MYVWLLIGAIVLLVALVVWNIPLHEGMTVDPDTLQAQRQALQMEGERRYNDVARLQNPRTLISADDMNAALAGSVPIPTSAQASLLSLVGSSGGRGAADDGSNKAGSPLEQTGTIQQKIDFCESLTTINCDLFDTDPRMAECGFCHRDGVNSKGKAHRGGMYISTDDQIRANAAAQGGEASYQPTVGTCAPRNFTLVKENCEAREAQLMCQAAGAATSNNQCGQCYGAAPANATGLLYVGPKPRTYNAILWLSHPGMHSSDANGIGALISMPGGSVYTVPKGTNPTLQPTPIPLNNIQEGDSIGITIYGFPMVWCAWISSPDGNRTVSIDIGLQNLAQTPGIVIAGDKRSQTVINAVNKYDSSTWSTFQNQVPNTVLWFARRDEVLHGGIIQAIFKDYNGNDNDVTSIMQQYSDGTMDFVVDNSAFNDINIPYGPGSLKIMLDNGQQTLIASGNTIPGRELFNMVNLSVTIPATLVDPKFADDKADCPTGPMVFTEVGAGLMGAHSCFKADGSFNPTQYCLQELFMAAGGTQQGTAFPNTDAKAAALVKNNSLDDTVANLNNLASIAQYGVDMNGAITDFATYVSASQQMLGRTPQNLCDGPNAAAGPQSPECLNYLWQSVGGGIDGTAAPMYSDGKTVNAANVQMVNEKYGSVDAIKQYYASIGAAATSQAPITSQADFDARNNAMMMWAGVSATIPPTPPDQCIPEVFNICPNGGYSLTSDEAKTVCEQLGARLATPQEIAEAQTKGADWCACGWASDGNAYYPMNTILPEYGYGCGTVGLNNCGQVAWSGGKACAACYGKKPDQGKVDGVLPFTQNMYSATTYTQTSGGYDEGSGMGQICFNNLSLDAAKQTCNSNPAPGYTCKSFSYSVDGSGAGCFKMDKVGFRSTPDYVGYTQSSSAVAGNVVWNAPRN